MLKKRGENKLSNKLSNRTAINKLSNKTAVLIKKITIKDWNDDYKLRLSSEEVTDKKLSESKEGRCYSFVYFPTNILKEIFKGRVWF